MIIVYVLLLAVCMILFGVSLFFIRRYHNLCEKINGTLDDIISDRPLHHMYLREGEIPNIQNKCVRIQEKLNLEVQHAEDEKEQVKQLISNMSHQLKTPLANVMIYQELLENTMLEEEKRALFEDKLRQQTNKIDWILQSLFKMVRLENHAIVFDCQLQPVKHAISRAIDEVYEKAQQKQIEVIVSKDISSLVLLHHEKWTAEVIVNILENAIKYSDENTVIRIEAETSELYSNINIIDQGVGIAKEEINQIFQRFYRSKAVENLEGTGIGLYLARMIMDHQHGYMTVHSVIGKGSCFSLFLQNCKN